MHAVCLHLLATGVRQYNADQQPSIMSSVHRLPPRNHLPVEVVPARDKAASIGHDAVFLVPNSTLAHHCE